MTYTSEHPIIDVTVDAVVLRVLGGVPVSVLLVRRGAAPYQGRWALPGGFVGAEEELVAAARRELAEETGLVDEALELEQLRTYGAPHRDPRGRTISVAHLAVVPAERRVTGGDDATHAAWVPLAGLDASDLAFDHAGIVADAVERVRGAATPAS